MDRALYVAMTGAAQTLRAQAVNSHNLANAGTVGFKAELGAQQAVAVNVLRGYKRAVVPMLIYAVALWGVGLGGGYALGLTHVDLAWLGLSTPLGAPGFWPAAIASLALASSLVTAYFLYVSRAAVSD